MGFGAGSGGSNSIASGTDVSLNNPANNEALVYNTSTSKWQNAAQSSSAPVTFATVPGYSTFTVTGTSTVARPSNRADIVFQFITTDGLAPTNALTGDIWLNAFEA